jgi:transposase
MSDLGIKRLDHHGIVMGVIQDLGIIPLIDERLGVYADEKLSVGTRIAAMILNGLGFTDQPLSLVPEFFEEIPIEHLFGDGITSSDFDRFGLSRALDRVSKYGEDTLFAEVAMHACAVSNIDLSHQSLDTTTFSMTGNYENDNDEGKIKITHGYSKDKRSDLKQIVTELIVSHDGGVPLVLKNWDGNANDSTIFKHRTEQLCDAFKKGYVTHLTADSKFYSEANSKHWHVVRFTTRVPETISDAKAIILQAQQEPEWYKASDGKTEYIAYDYTHFNTDQRWVVCRSEESIKRAEKSLIKLVEKEQVQLEKDLFHLQAQRFTCQADAEKASKKINKKLKYHSLTQFEYKEIRRFEKPGYSKDKAPTHIEYQVIGAFERSDEKIKQARQIKYSFVLATNMPAHELSDENVISSYKDQQHVERGYRFLKDPQFFANAFFLKNPSRISALIMVMTLALLVYSIAQKRLTLATKQQKASFKNQAGVSKNSLTVRRAFQLFRGVYTLPSSSSSHYKFIVDGLNEIRISILNLLGGTCLRYYYDARKEDLHAPNMAM